MASCEEEQERAKAAAGLKLRLELERKHTTSCHELIESGLEIERIYTFLLKELMEVEEDKMKEIERRISTSQEHSRVLTKESATKRSSLLASFVGGSSMQEDGVIVIEDDKQVSVDEPSGPVTTSTQPPSKKQVPKMKNFSLIISKSKKVTNEDSDESSQRHQVCSPQKQEISSPVQVISPKQNRVKQQQPEKEKEINVSSESEGATSPEIPMQNQEEDFFLHVIPRRKIYQRLVEDTDNEPSFVKESPRKLTSGSRIPRSSYSSIGGFNSCSVEKETVVPSQRAVAVSSPTKKLQPRDKVAAKNVPQPVKIAKETSTESSSEKEETIVTLPKRKRRNRLVTLEGSVRTSPHQRTRRNKEEEEEEAFDLNPQSPKHRSKGKELERVISSPRSVTTSSPAKKIQPHDKPTKNVEKVAKECQATKTTTESSSEEEETIITFPKRKRRNRLVTLEDNTAPLLRTRKSKKQMDEEEEEVFDLNPQSPKPRLARKVSSPRTMSRPLPTKKQGKVVTRKVTQPVKVAKDTTAESPSEKEETVILPKRKRKNLLATLEDGVRTSPLQKTRARTNKEDNKQEEEAFDLNPQDPGLPKRKMRKNKSTKSKRDENSLATEPSSPVRQRVTSPSAVRLRSRRAQHEKRQELEKERREEPNGPESLSTAEPRLQHQRNDEDGRETSKPVGASSPPSLRRRKSRSPKRLVQREDKEPEQKGREEKEVESLTLANTVMVLSPLRERMLRSRKEETENRKRCTKVAGKSVVEMEGSKRRKNKSKPEEASKGRETLSAAEQLSSQVEERSKDERIIMLRPPKQIPNR